MSETMKPEARTNSHPAYLAEIGETQCPHDASYLLCDRFGIKVWVHPEDVNAMVIKEAHDQLKKIKADRPRL